jgi:hypothetical protein
MEASVSAFEPDPAVAIRPGEHACCRFVHAQDRLQVASAFVRGALRRGHKVLYLCDSDEIEAPAELLASASDEVRAAIERGQVEVRPSRSAYTPDGSFDAERMLRTIREERDRALAEGYPALSMTGEMAWAQPHVPGYDHLAEFESRFAEVMGEGECLALCQYPHGDFDPGTLSHVAAVHPVDIAPELAGLVRTGMLAGARTENGQTLRLAGELDYACADAVVSVLDGHFHGPLRLDLADISFVDVAGMRAIRGRTGQPLTIAGASAPVRRMVGLLAWDTDAGVEVLA